MAVYVVMPAFNEVGKIGAPLASMPRDIGGCEVSVVVVDDGSTDGTDRMAQEHGAFVLRHGRNRGKGAALATGLAHLRNKDVDVVAWMDSDGQHLSRSLPDVVAPVLSGELDLCVGSRYLQERQPNSAPLNRRLVRGVSVAAVRRITGFVVTDPFSGFRCFSKSAFDIVVLEGHGYESELESTFAVARAGMSYGEVPIPKIYGPDTSKMGHRYGRLLGRIVIVSAYARTIGRAWKQRRSSVSEPLGF